MLFRPGFFILACVVPLFASDGGWAAERCLDCHSDLRGGLAEAHRFAEHPCSTCHGGNSDAVQLPDAHHGLMAFPGNLDNAREACGACHPAQVAAVDSGPMHTGTHMVQITRRVFGENPPPGKGPTLQTLSQTPADSLMRKLCAGCHLGRARTQHRLDVTHDRGGGCLACHVNEYPDRGHPALSIKVEDGRCFGCHSRSSRISLNYAGLAEADVSGSRPDRFRLARLRDGRLVEHRPADIHHQAGMACIDCHTGDGLMSKLPVADRQDQAVDIACDDCHRNRNARIEIANWPGDSRWMLERVPFSTRRNQEFLTTRNGTPLWHIEVGSDDLTLHSKLTPDKWSIPVWREESHGLQTEHQRLTCDACHAQWAPQCYECHLSYSSDSEQWDHIERKFTPGHWSQHLANIRNDLPPLGVTAEGEITTFVPGMIMSVEHPEFSAPLFRRLFGSLSPHTTGPARACETCHFSSVALGLGQGRLEKREGAWVFRPEHQPLQDGLPADAWTTLESERPGRGTYSNDHSFNREELIRILNAAPPATTSRAH